MAALSPKLTAAQSPNCERLTFTDATQYPYPNDPANIYARNILVYNNCNELVSTGSQAQSFCLGITGLPAIGDVFTVTLNDCAYSYTVEGTDVELPNSVPWTSVVSVTQTGTVGQSATLVLLVNAPTNPNVTVNFFLQATVQQTLQVAVQAINNAITLAGYDNTKFYVSASGAQLSIFLDYYYAANLYGFSNINGLSCYVTTGLASRLSFSPTDPQYSGGMAGSSTPEQAEQQTQANVLNQLCRVLQEGCNCTNAIVACNPCTQVVPGCGAISITSAYPGVTLDISVSSQADVATLTLTETIPNQTNMLLPSSGISNRNDYTIPLTGDGVYCARLTLYERIPAQCYADIGPITFGGEIAPGAGSFFAIGFSVNDTIDGVDLSGGIAVYPTWQGSVLATINKAVQMFNEQVASLGISSANLRAVRNGTSIRIILSSAYDCESAVFIGSGPTENVPPFTYSTGWLFGGIALQEIEGPTGSIEASENIYETEGCFAVTCSIECALANRLYKNLNGGCKATLQDWEYTNELQSRLAAIRNLMCEGNINGAKDLIFDTTNLLGPSNCKQCLPTC